jgi:hypothetical protein
MDGMPRAGAEGSPVMSDMLIREGRRRCKPARRGLGDQIDLIAEEGGQRKRKGLGSIPCRETRFGKHHTHNKGGDLLYIYSQYGLEYKNTIKYT